ncbi:MAG TPA: glycosyltransferase family 4 protein [Polyangia bacterium]|nr:glycosyltransferase family 4 protein [Polyangia bacterium]
MRVLAITQIFPNAVEPLAAPFNRQQFAALGRRCELEVLATIPWFPGARWTQRWAAAGRLDEVPRHERIAGLEVEHPRYLHVPRVGYRIADRLYTASLLRSVLGRRGAVDVVLAAWAYPDGAAAVALGRLLGVPVVVKVHGTDINYVAKLPGPSARLRRVLPEARRVVAVSRPLAEEVIRLGVPEGRVVVVRNGIDNTLFRPLDRAEARARLGLAPEGKWLVYVGRLERTKGTLDLLEAFARLAPRRRDLSLALVGNGSAREECAALAARVGAQVRLLGGRPLAEVPLWLGASELLVLPSWNEGTPNVLLEALACGRPVVATRVGGIPDLVTDPSLGELVPARDPAALAQALERVADGVYDGAAIAARGARGSWDESAAHLLTVLEEAVRGA